ncbi:amidohydrolase family protein [Adhaeribacter rhizoryzae]|uniref:Amidohydrolase family protein n=1 Tax=Adhaeribacter rhizoryzae TaxID=2607907 RepID=A0A5M6D929_9BACT|nr:amidohydrolase family protein [Adhaeribacter rhizoryzae]KAA5542980.1 amidohydrolase family protein [Adhaeribacter rhizoryzae]
MIKYFQLIIVLLSTISYVHAQKVFDTHIHGNTDPATQITKLKAAGVYKAAISTSWNIQSTYKSTSDFTFLHGIMLVCPNGKVPYSNQYCFEDKKDFPNINLVEQLIKENKIQFIGEVLSQYYGISPSDERLYPYYELAEKYRIPVGIHTGLAGPDHGSPNFKVRLGTPMLLEDLLQKYPKLKIWIMHAGAPFLDDTIAIMKYYENVYADISAINNPYIFPPSDFKAIMKKLIDAGLEDRLMFGSDNGNIDLAIESIEKLDFLSNLQKEKIYSKNAEVFFKTNK